MRTLGTFVLIVLGFAGDALAQSCASTQGQLEYCKALTNAVRFGFPRYTTALLPTCNTNNKGAVAYDTTTDTVKYCTGSAWTAVGTPFTGGAITTPILAPAADNCASVPYSFSGDTDTGMCASAANTLWMYADGGPRLRVDGSGIYVPGKIITDTLQDSTGKAQLGITDGIVRLFPPASSGGAPMEVHWEYSWTDSSNHQGGVLKTSATGIEIAAETAGSGADNLDVTLTPAGTGKVVLGGTASPAATDACTQWSVVADASYIYVCTASGAWKRAALTGGY